MGTAAVGRSFLLKKILLLAFLTGLYFVTGKLSLGLASIHASASPVWPATGIALAAVLLFGARVWPAVFLGAFLVNFTTAGSAATSIGIAAGNTLEALIGARLAQWTAGGADVLQRPQTVLRFVLVVALAATVSATIGLLSLLAGGYAQSDRAAAIWLTWWAGDATGGLAVAPLLLAWARPRRQLAPTGSPVEAIALALVTVGITGVVWSQPDPLAYWVIPPLVWAAIRFGSRGAATTSFLVAALALWGTVQTLGPFATEDANRSLLILLGFIAIATTTSLVLAAAVRERERVEQALRRSRDELEEQVRARTVSLANAVQDLEHSRSTLNDAQRVAHVGSWEWDVLANRVTWSDELYRIYGLEPGSADVTYQAYLERVHPDDRESASNSVRAALEGGQEFAFEERIVRPDGEVRVLQSRGYVVRDESGLPQRMIGTCHDITARKLDELELHRRMDALNRTNAELSMLSYAASHDLREPLRTVASNVQLIQQRLGGDAAPEIARSAAFAVDGVRRMEELITDLLEYSNADRTMRGTADAEGALAEARARLSAAIQETGATIESGPLPRVTAGPARLVGLFQNLLSNAIKYRGDGRRPDVRITAVRDGDGMWRFDVADNGRGFDSADAERLFTIFERLDADPGIPGTGLGLAICRRTVEAQGGRIWAESERDRGSVFHFTLPVAPEADAPR